MASQLTFFNIFKVFILKTALSYKQKFTQEIVQDILFVQFWNMYFA